tara:strand:- start:117 stop:1133 length:1017 start_codon:yes stop_codon:yes gene_type:complete
MASSASPDLKIQLMATGENSGAWGTITNNNLSAIEEAIARTTDVTFANDTPTASVTLTDSNALQAGRNFRLNLIGTGTAGHVLLLPTVEKSYLINNTLSVDVSVRNGTAAGTNLFNTQTVPAGGAAMVYTDGSAVTSAVSSASAMEVLNALSVGGNASVGGTLHIEGNASAKGTFAFGGNVTAAGTFTLGGTVSAKSTLRVGGAVTLDSTLSVVDNTSVGGTFLATGGVSDVDGDLRDIPRSRTIAITTVSAAQTDAGNFIFLTSSDQTVVIPTAAGTFDTGDIFSVVCAGASATISSNITSMFKVGEASATATITLGANKIASVLFVSAQHAYVTGT